MRKSAKTALGGIVAALSLVLMLLTTVIPFLTYALPALAGVVLTVMVIEIDRKWAFVSYLAVALLSLFILADKEAAMMYAAFFGYYPVAKSLIEEKLPKDLGWVVKFAIFNVSVVGAYLLILYVFRLPVDGMDHFGKLTVPIYLAMANLVFLLFDYTLTRLIMLYLARLRRVVRRIFK